MKLRRAKSWASRHRLRRKGESDLDAASKENEVVAICDVDADTLARAAKKFPNAKQYRDFRKMLDEVKSIDAVTVSTPDHAHYPAAMHAIALGKQVCVQKPLTNTLWEARELHKAAKKKGIISQMGNQGHTYDDNRKLKEWLDAGVIGKVQEIHVWTNRPIWHRVTRSPSSPATFRQTSTGRCGLPQLPIIRIPRTFIPSSGGDSSSGAPAPSATWLPPHGSHLQCAGTWHAADGRGRMQELTDIAWPLGAVVTYHWKNHPKLGDVTMKWYEGKMPTALPSCL
jgi:hypothetical protein